MKVTATPTLVMEPPRKAAPVYEEPVKEPVNSYMPATTVNFSDHPLLSKLECNNCSNHLMPDASFCRNCGTPVEKRVAEDGVAYTMSMFIQHYGGLDEWEKATKGLAYHLAAYKALPRQALDGQQKTCMTCGRSSLEPWGSAEEVSTFQEVITDFLSKEEALKRAHAVETEQINSTWKELHEKEINHLNKQHAQEIDDINAQWEESMKEQAAYLRTVENELAKEQKLRADTEAMLTETKGRLTKAKATIEEKDQSIVSLEAEMDDLRKVLK